MMRRWLGAVVIVALLAVLYPGIAFASLHPTLLSASVDDFRSQVFHRVFFEAESTVRFSLNDGDRLSESFFRKYALRIAESPVGSGTASITVPNVALPLLPSHLFEPVSLGAVPVVQSPDYGIPAIPATQPSLVVQPTPLAELYRDASPQPTIAPASLHFDMTNASDYASRLVTFDPVMNPQDSFTAGASGPDPTTTLPQQQAGISVPVRVGHVQVQPHFEGSQATVPSMSLHDSATNTGATFNTRVGPQKFNVDLSSSYEHLTIDPQVNASSFDMTSNWQVGNGGVPILTPAYADVSKRTLAAGVGVPVARNLTLNVQAATEHLQGGYGAPGLANLDATNNVYGGKVTFQLPHSASSISLSAKQYRYQDNLTPNTYTQTNANVNFTVKF